MTGPSPGGGAGDGPAARSLALLAVVALAGAGTMVVELGAVRLLAPWFGTSSSVWTNVIGVVLAALALGYALGARLTACADPEGRLGTVLLVAAALAAALPRAAGPVAEFLMPEDVPLHKAAGVLVWGSLASSALLFLPAAAALGCAGPLAVEALQRLRGGGAGAAGGRVLAASTLGSLAGTFGTTHVLVPGVGIARSFVVAAAALAVAGLALALRGRRPGPVQGAALLLALVLGAASASGGALTRGVRAGETLLAARESSVQSIRAVETAGPDGPIRVLRVNESLDSFQSVWVPEPGLLPPGHYYNLFALPVAWSTREARGAPERWRVLVLGLGAGTAVRVLEGVVPGGTELETLGLEVDEEVLAVARAHFDLEEGRPGRVAVGGADGRAALRFVEGRFDQVILDAYANNMEIPPHLATVEAFRTYAARLVEGGWLTVNVGGFGADDPVVLAVARSAAEGLGAPVHLARVPLSRNWVVFGRKGAGVPRPGERAFGSLGADLGLGVDRLVPPLEVPGAWVTVQPGGAGLLVDDSSATEALQARSIAEAARRLEAMDTAPEPAPEPRGDGSPPPGERDRALAADALRLLQRGDYTDALAACDEIEHPGLAGETAARVHWAAGSPMAAFERASAALREDPEHLPLLALAVDAGLAVGAERSSMVRLERLTDAVGEDPAWAPTLERLRTFVTAAALGRRDAEGATRRAQLTLGAVLVLVAVAGALLGRRGAAA